jgi:flagellar protein FliO/FliZ
MIFYSRNPYIHLKKFILLCFIFIVSAHAMSAEDIVVATSSIKANTLSNHSGNLLEVFLSLFAVIVVILILAWAIKVMGYKGVAINKAMKVTACLPLSSKEKLMVVQIGDEQILIGVAPGFVSHIKTLDKPLDLVETSNQSEFSVQSFSKTFNQLIKGKKVTHDE